MLRSTNPEFDELRGRLDAIPVVDAHNHWCGVCERDEKLDILGFIATGDYYLSDLASASDDFPSRPRQPGIFALSPLVEFVADRKRSFDERYDAWFPYHQRTTHTAYARAAFEGMKVCWGMKDVSKRSLLQTQERMRAERDQSFCDRALAAFGIRAMVANVGICEAMSGALPYRDVCRFVFGLPDYHDLSTECAVRKPHLERALGRKIVTLDDYLEAFERFLKEAIAFGIVGMKDQTAYRRDIGYGNPARASAEAMFNRIMAQPRDTFGTSETRDLDDFLFHQFMRLAARFDLPVQIHTGHMAGIRNEILKTNPANLTGILELHQDVTFDLFHGGWPFIGEFLFLGKNYPNVMLDMCWANLIDPLYSIELLQRAVVTIPHSKMSGFGGDTSGPERTVGYLVLARDNIACALSELINRGWLSMDDSLDIARAWLFDNPNRIFKLRLDGDRLRGIDPVATGQVQERQ